MSEEKNTSGVCDSSFREMKRRAISKRPLRNVLYMKHKQTVLFLSWAFFILFLFHSSVMT